MSLAMVFKGPEGIVLAADSRVTLNATTKINGKDYLFPSTYDNATKLLTPSPQTKQTHVGAVTYGAGAIGQTAPRTAHSFMPEFDAQLIKEGVGRLSVEDFSKKFSAFFMEQWNALMPAGYAPAANENMIFLLGGFDENSVYGKVFQVSIPSGPIPQELNSGDGEFGLVYGGQAEFSARLLSGYDEQLIAITKKTLSLADDKEKDLREALKALSTAIPFQFLPLQDCVNLSIFLIRTTITLQTWQVGIRGVGGYIDVATVTQTKGYLPVQQKEIKGEFIE
jgi:hypothetical protein